MTFFQASAANIYRFKEIVHVKSVYFDCTGLIYRLSYSLPIESINPIILLDKLKKNVFYYLNIIRMFPEINTQPINLHLVFDGKPPKEKRIIQNTREEKNIAYVNKCLSRGKPLMGLSSICRSKRSDIISKVSCDVFNYFVNHDEENIDNIDSINISETFKGCGQVFVSTSSEEGEADIKIVKSILGGNKNENEYVIIVTCDTDIFISLESLRSQNVLVILSLPFSGQYCLLSKPLNVWLQSNSIPYKNLLAYMMFFCGSDYETPLISGTKNQITTIFNFAKENNFIVSINNFIRCWSILNIKRSNEIQITNLNIETLKRIVFLKLRSTYENILYYSYGNNPSGACLVTNTKWSLLIKHILPSQIKSIIKNLDI